MWSAARLSMLYALFVALATAANLASQWLTFMGAGRLGFAWGTTLFPALIVGTGAGLIVKYVLENAISLPIGHVASLPMPSGSRSTR